jgi:hypothetical protein
MVYLENYLDPDVAYLLGLITARGSLLENPDRRLIIEFPYSNLIVEGVKIKYDQDTQLKLGTSMIRDRLTELLETDVQVISTKGLVTILVRFFRNSIAWRNIKLYTQGKTSHSDFEIPPQIMEAPPDIQKEFVRGIADVAGYIRQSNNYFGKKRRVYIEIPNPNWILPVQLCHLLQVKLSVPVQLIQWGHPNTREPHKREKGTSWAREHQLKIFAESFEPIGFYIEYKQKILKEFIEDDRKRFPGDLHFCNPNPKIRKYKEKPRHPEEKSRRLPPEVRKHFDCYWQICTSLGCTQRRDVPGDTQLSFLDDEEEQ